MAEGGQVQVVTRSNPQEHGIDPLDAALQVEELDADPSAFVLEDARDRSPAFRFRGEVEVGQEGEGAGQVP